jgi:hypothetical protein
VMEHGAEAEHVAPLVGRAPGESFGARVLGAHFTLVRSEANELDSGTSLGLLGHQNGERREVPVNQTGVVRGLQAGGGLQAQVHGLLHRQGAPRIEKVPQQLAGQILEDDVNGPVAGLAYLMDRGDVGMLDLKRPVERLPQPCQRGRVTTVRLGLQDYESDLETARVSGAVEWAFRSHVQLVQDAEATG